MADNINNLNNQSETLLNYINKLANSYDNAANENYKRMGILGYNPANSQEIISDHIIHIQRMGIKDISPQCSSVSEISSDIIQTLKEQKDLAAIKASISKENEKIKTLEKLKKELERDFNDRSQKRQESLDLLKQMDWEVSLRRHKPEDLVPDFDHVFDRFDLDKVNLRTSREQIEIKETRMLEIKREIKSIQQKLEKYDNIPPDLCLAKNLLEQVKKEQKKLESQVKEHFKKNSYD